MHSLLQRVPILAGLNGDAIELLTGHAREAALREGEFVVREGETGNRFFLLQSGEVRVVKHAGAPNEVELARLGPMDFFGEMCILETLPRSASVQAVKETSVLSISSMDFLRLYQAKPDQYGILLLNVARDLSRRLRKLDEAFAATH